MASNQKRVSHEIKPSVYQGNLLVSEMTAHRMQRISNLCQISSDRKLTARIYQELKKNSAGSGGARR